MKPTSPIDTEMVFLRDVERRLADLRRANENRWALDSGIGGLQSVVQHRIAEVTKLRDKEKECLNSEAGPR